MIPTRVCTASVLFHLAAISSFGQVTHVVSEHAIGDGAGGFGGALQDFGGFGESACRIGDVDGDGVADMAVGAPFEDEGGPSDSNRGAVWILFLNADGTVRAQQKIASNSGGLSTAPGSAGLLQDGARFGESVCPLGDLDGDGVPDLGVGAPGFDDGGFDFGSVWLLLLNPDGTVKFKRKLSMTTQAVFPPLTFESNLGNAVASLGDLDGNGMADLATGGLIDALDRDSSAAWILRLTPAGNVAGYVVLDQSTFPGLDDGDEFGAHLAALGDVNGDGTGDLAVCARWDDDGGHDRGAVWVIFLAPDGSWIGRQKISSTSGGLRSALHNGQEFGTSVAGLGDLDGDGTPDMAVASGKDAPALRSRDLRSASGWGGIEPQGAVWILLLRPDGTVKAEQKIRSLAGLPFAEYGSSLAFLGDLDGSGAGPRFLAVGEPIHYSSPPLIVPGAVWMLGLAP